MSTPGKFTSKFSVWVVLLFSVLQKTVLAQETLTSLYVPGFDPQPLSAVPLGVDAQGRTTYEILPGSPTGTFSEPNFIGTATLVEGGNEASLTYDPPFKPSNGVGYSCTIDGASAVCVGVFGTETETLTENAAPITVQIDPAATPTTTDVGGSTGGSTAAGGISSPQTGSSTSGNPSETTDTNSNTANRNRTDILFAIWGVLLTTFSVGVYF